MLPKKHLSCLLLFACIFSLQAQICTHTNTIQTNGIPTPQMNDCDDLVKCFMEDHNIPGATFALARNGKMVYMRSFGYADQASTEDTQPYHLFRIASISKPITAVAIMKLVENGLLNLNDKAFGATGIINDAYFNSVISDSRIYDITVQQLLEHSGGWDRSTICTPNPASPYPWTYSHCDPLGFPLHVTQTLGESNPVSERATIKFLCQKGLDFTPGTGYAYSNVGYLVLGEIIEQITGMEYEDYVKTAILEPIGICDMHIGKNLLTDKMEREGEYNSPYTVPDCYGTGSSVPWQYGGWNLEAMDAHGGWIATARDLVKLLVSVDGFASKPDILSAASITTMVAPSANNAYYAKGWSVNPSNNWWHTGSLNGSASFFARTSGQYTWAVILNERSSNASFWGDFDGLPWNCISSTSTFPTHDWLLAPQQSASNMTFANVLTSQMDVTWTSGDGQRRLVIAKAGTAVDEFPLDGVNYTANSNFGAGTDLGNGNYVVYDGTGNNFSLNNLSPGTNYYFRIIEYNQNSNTGNYALYRLCDSPSYERNTTLELSVKVYLQGPYSGGMMSTDLLTNGLIPLTQPYTSFGHTGTESVTTIPADVVDWVLLELRNPMTTVVATRAAFLKKDGSVVDLDGASPVIFDNLSGNYWIAVRHRNHLGIMLNNVTMLN